MLEVIVSRTNFISSHTQRQLRIIGLSTAMANAADLASWLSGSSYRAGVGVVLTTVGLHCDVADWIVLCCQVLFIL